jgi:hypothetical protein
MICVNDCLPPLKERPQSEPLKSKAFGLTISELYRPNMRAGNLDGQPRTRTSFASESIDRNVSNTNEIKKIQQNP